MEPKLQVCAVSYLNTVPLVWGMLHGEQRGLFDLTFRIPAVCADMVSGGQADIGILPVFELLRQKLEIIPRVGIACRGAIRSILLVSKVPPAEIRTLAADSSSRTSVQLARVILARRYGAHPRLFPHDPALPDMMAEADAALMIGDPALRVDAASIPWSVYDLGAEWWDLTGLPMVFAVWAGRKEVITPEVIGAFQQSYAFGRERVEEIVACESAPRGFTPELVRSYLTHNVVSLLGDEEYAGMRRFLEYAGAREG